MPSREKTYCLRLGYSGTQKTSRKSESMGPLCQRARVADRYQTQLQRGEGRTRAGWEVLGAGTQRGAPSPSARSRGPTASRSLQRHREIQVLAGGFLGLWSCLWICCIMKQSARNLQLADTSKREVCCWAGAACPEPDRQFVIPTPCRNQALLDSPL